MADPPVPPHPFYGIAVRQDRTPRAPADAVAEDTRLAMLVGDGSRPPTYRIWENARSLVVTAREARLPSFTDAASRAESRGWRVVRRDSGGTVVPHGPGILQTSLLMPQSRVPPGGVEHVYEALCRPVRRALADLGLDATFGDVPGSFCDGRFNLVVEGRKVAGTSQRWKGGLPPGHRPGAYVVAHMVLFVEGDLAGATAAVNRFCAEAGSTQSFDPGAVVTVAELLRGRAGPDGLTDRLRLAIADAVEAPRP